MNNNDVLENNTHKINLKLHSEAPIMQNGDISPSKGQDSFESEIKQMESSFSAKELKQIDSFCEQIDITDTNLVLQYGIGAQKKISNFSDTALERVRTKDVGDVGEMLTNLICELNGFSTEDVDFSGKNSRWIKRMMKTLQTQFSKVSTNVSSVVTTLEEHQLVLMQDISTLEGLYNRTQLYFKAPPCCCCASCACGAWKSASDILRGMREFFAGDAF